MFVHLIFWKVFLFRRVRSCFEPPTTANWLLWHRWSCNIWSYGAERPTDNKGFFPAISFNISHYSTQLDVEGSGAELEGCFCGWFHQLSHGLPYFWNSLPWSPCHIFPKFCYLSMRVYKTGSPSVFWFLNSSFHWSTSTTTSTTYNNLAL